MKSKNKPKPRQKRGAEKRHKPEAQPVPRIDEIITISTDSGRPRLELRKTEDTAVLREQSRAEAKAAEPAEKKFRLPKRPESIIPMRKPKAEPLKETEPETKGSAKERKPIRGAAAERKSHDGSASEPKEQPVSTAPLSTSKSALAEAALFLSPKPLMLDELARIMGVSSLGYVKETLNRLARDYDGSGIEVVSSAAGWGMQVKPQYLGSVAHLAPYANISEGPKRALALILFKEPLKQSDLIKMQGNKVYEYLKVLERMGMIRREPWGRTKKLTLTREFERYFGEEKDAIRQRLAEEIANQPQHAEVQQPAAPKRKIDVKAELNKMGIELEES